MAIRTLSRSDLLMPLMAAKSCVRLACCDPFRSYYTAIRSISPLRVYAATSGLDDSRLCMGVE